MWICLNTAFVSIVADRDNPANLMVRGRAKGHIEKAFPGYTAQHTPDADYAYRCSIPRIEARDIIAYNITAIDYDNFKDSVDDRSLHDVYMNFWVLMVGYQRRNEPRPRLRMRDGRTELRPTPPRPTRAPVPRQR